MINCGGGIPRCTASCTLDYFGAGACTDCPVCDNDGICEQDEDCNGCPNDCVSGSGASCGNGICEAGNGENCVSCPSDCNGIQNGNPSGRFCCGDGGGANPLSCSNSLCTQGSFECMETANSGSCCGDLTCEGIENSASCEIDCGPAPYCGDSVCDADEDSCSCPTDCGAPSLNETSMCSDGIDNDCDTDVDCSDLDCSSDASCQCSVLGDSCTDNGDCCEFKCRGKAGSKTCK